VSTFYIKLRYRGRLRHPAEVERLADEVEDICRSNGWNYHRWENDWSKPASVRLSMTDGVLMVEGHAPLRGVSFNPPDCETVWLTFTPDGVLHSLLSLNDPSWTSDIGGHAWQRVKTGADGARMHLLLCGLFIYLHEKYFAEFDCQDESGYWQHRDAARLEAFMDNIQEDWRQLNEELLALQNDEDLAPEKKREIFYDLMRQFGERHKPG